MLATLRDVPKGMDVDAIDGGTEKLPHFMRDTLAPPVRRSPPLRGIPADDRPAEHCSAFTI